MDLRNCAMIEMIFNAQSLTLLSVVGSQYTFDPQQWSNS